MDQDRKELEDFFGYRTPFTSKELYEFYSRDKEFLKEGTFRWKVSKLKSKDIISSLCRGVYILDDRKKFQYDINMNIKRIFKSINNTFPKLDMCIWTTSWVHSEMNHQPFTSIIVVEVDKDLIEIAFNILREKFQKVYLNPHEDQIERYILDDNVIVIKPIIKDCPVTKYQNINVAKIEKILVDLFFEYNLFQTYQGKELVNIFENIYSKYSINTTTLYRYANKRGIKSKIDIFLNEDTNIDKVYLGGGIK